jgi:hypothetical protein
LDSGWSAGDSTNQIKIYENSSLLATFTASDITNLLGGNAAGKCVTALNGTQYTSSSYYGNPNTAFKGQDSAEPFAYVSILATDFTFNKIVFANASTSGFETDNNSVRAGLINIPTDYSSFVKVSDIDLATPEPASAGIVGVALGAAFLALRRRRRPAA